MIEAKNVHKKRNHINYVIGLTALRQHIHMLDNTSHDHAFKPDFKVIMSLQPIIQWE